MYSSVLNVSFSSKAFGRQTHDLLPKWSFRIDIDESNRDVGEDTENFHAPPFKPSSTPPLQDKPQAQTQTNTTLQFYF